VLGVESVGVPTRKNEWVFRRERMRIETHGNSHYAVPAWPDLTDISVRPSSDRYSIVARQESGRYNSVWSEGGE
jgi:hypothetical protein